MNVYLINIVLLFVYAAFVKLNGGSLRRLEGKQGAMLFCILAALNWILISGLRHESVGDDTLTYREYYEAVAYLSWEDVFNYFIGVYSGSEQGKDPGYMVFEKISQVFVFDFTAYLLIIAFIFTGLMGRWIYKYSDDVFISFLMYSILFFAFFSITGLRQTIATALVVFVGYDLIIKRRLGLFVLVTVIAATIHKSAVVFFIFYFIHSIKLKRYQFVLALFLFPVLFFLKNIFSSFFKVLAGFEDYGVFEGAGTYSFTLVMLVIGGVLIWKYDKIINSHVYSVSFVNAYLLALFLIPLTFVNPSAMRVVQYFSIFLLLLVPLVIRSFNVRERSFVYAVILVLMVALFFKSGAGGGYIFFWQDYG